ncbi:MAG: aminopeptidase [Gammaproteobacteria bacterium]|nr:aminopeptidase [Gammaproteobacteria bacterium]
MFTLRLTATLLITALLSGCASVQYYSQGVKGHLEVWWPKKPIDDVIHDQSQPEDFRQRLALMLKARKFASNELALPDNKSYTTYTDLGRPYVVWNVFAAGEFSLEPKSWCYLMVGCLNYRGYFDATEAKLTADSLAQQGYDVSVEGVSAYSTLGWFNDPLLNTMLQWSDNRRIELIFHELAHQVVYLSSETDFNESMATAVARLGMVRWYQTQHPDKLNEYFDLTRQHAEFRQLLLETSQQLRQIYSSNQTTETKRHDKAQVFADLQQKYSQTKQHWPRPNAFDSWFARPLNNAHITASMTYLQQTPAFYALYLDSQKDWPTFLNSIKKLGKLPRQQREETVKQLLQRNITLQQASTT